MTTSYQEGNMLLSYHERLEKYGTDYQIKKTYRKVIYL